MRQRSSLSTAVEAAARLAREGFATGAAGSNNLTELGKRVIERCNADDELSLQKAQARLVEDLRQQTRSSPAHTMPLNFLKTFPKAWLRLHRMVLPTGALALAGLLVALLLPVDRSLQPNDEDAPVARGESFATTVVTVDPMTSAKALGDWLAAQGVMSRIIADQGSSSDAAVKESPVVLQALMPRNDPLRARLEEVFGLTVQDHGELTVIFKRDASATSPSSR